MRTLFMLLIVVAIFSFGCGSSSSSSTDTTGTTDTTDTTDTAVSFSSSVQPIFDTNCVECHSSGGIASFQILTSGSSYDNIVSVSATRGSLSGLRVAPGDSANSILYLRISGTTVGAQMPFGRTPLSSSDQTTIMTWIDEGAENN